MSSAVYSTEEVVASVRAINADRPHEYRPGFWRIYYDGCATILDTDLSSDTQARLLLGWKNLFEEHAGVLVLAKKLHLMSFATREPHG